MENSAESNTTISEPSESSNTDYLKFVGGRKFVLSLIVIFISALLCWFTKIDGGVYSLICVTVVTGFAASNVLQKINVK